MRAFLQISAVVLAAALPLRAAAAPKDCEDFRAKLPKGTFQGFLDVPEDWAAPNGAKIKIFYYGKKAAGGQVPLVFFNGGPAQDSHESYNAFVATEQGRTEPLLFIDQRGTGCSSTYPAGNDVKSLTRLLKYGSRSIVRDAEAVRKKVYGDKVKWRAFGQSYGGYIVHRYIEAAPEGLAAALAHGAAIFQDDGDFLRLRLLAQKRSTDVYFAKYPLDRANLAQARAQIRPDTCFQDKSMKVCGPPIIDSLIYILAFENEWADLHGLIQNLATNNKATLAAYVQSAILTERSSTLLPAGVISVLEAPLEGPDAKGKTSCDVALGRIKAAGIRPEDWVLNECRYMGSIQSLGQPSNDALSQTTFNPDPFSLGGVVRALKANPALEFYLYASKDDPLVPAGAFVDEAKQLGNRVHFRYLKDSAHDGFLTEPRVWADIVATGGGGKKFTKGKKKGK